MASKLSEIDQVLIRYADTLSLNAISFKLDGELTPAQCGARIAHLLDTPDFLTAAQQDQLVTMKMRQLIVNLEEMTLTARTAEVIVRALESVGARLDKRAEATERDLSTLYAFQGTVMLDAINVAMAHMRGALTAGDELAEEQWDNALESALRFAQIELTKHDVDADEEEQHAIEAPKARSLPSPRIPIRSVQRGK